MKRKILNGLLLVASIIATQSIFAQTRYLDEVFTDAEIIKAQENQVYGINVDFLNNQLLQSSAYVNSKITQIQAEHNEIRDSLLAAIAGGYSPNIPVNYFTPYAQDTSREIKLINPRPDDPANSIFNPFQMGMMDVYMPNPAIDTVTDRPVIIYLHTGNFLPKGINGGVTGRKNDPVAIELCEQWAKRGYVAIAANYRLGWDPTNSSQSVRTRTLLNGVYRAIGDVKQVVRSVKSQSAALGIDPDNIILYGQGSGGYVSLAYNFLDDYAETTLPKFDPEATGVTVIDTNIVGGVDGRGGILNFYQYQSSPNVDADIAFCVNAGGALGDTSWINGGESPNVSFHAIRDPFAPFTDGTVIVPTTGGLVVDASGANTFMPIVNRYGNNSSFENINDFNDYATTRARQVYGQTYSDDIPIIIGGQPVTVSTEAEGMFAFDTEQTNSAPWEWWSEADFNAYHAYLTQLNFGPPTLFPAQTIIDGQTGPNDEALSQAYLDTMQLYMHRRIMVELQIGDWEAVGTEDALALNNAVSMYPNPAHGSVQFQSNGTEIETLEIYDLTGKAVIPQVTVAGNYYFLDLNSFESGMYIVRMQTGAGIQTDRLVVD